MNHPDVLLPTLYQEGVYALPEKTLVVLGRTWDSLSPDDVILLGKILSAVNLNLAAVRIVTSPTLTPELVNFPRPEKILTFGVAAPDNKPYELQQWAGIPIVTAEDFPLLDDAKKRTLWLTLKAMFGISK